MLRLATEALSRLMRVGDQHRTGTQLFRGSVATAGIKFGYIGLRLAGAVVLARLLGPAEFGVYSYVFALVSLLAIPAQFGLPTLVVRETAKAQASRQWDLMRGLWRWTTAISVMFTLGISIIAVLVIWVFLPDVFTESQLQTFGLGLLLVPLGALANLRGAALRGLRRVVEGQVPEFILRPFLLVGFAAAVVWLWPSYKLTSTVAMALQVIAATVAFSVGAYLLWRARPVQLLEKPAPRYEHRMWLSATFPMAVVAAMQYINQYTDILMLGMFLSAEEVGVYRVAAQSATFSIIGLQIVNMVVAPQFARLHTLGDRVALQKLVESSAKACVFTALPVSVSFCFAGHWILGWVFGEAYAEGHLPLAILSIGQLVSAGIGPVGSLLSMTGHERDTARGVMIAACVNVVLNLMLIPPLGMAGAALATSGAMCTWNVVLWRAVRQRLNISTVNLLSKRTT